MKTAFFFQHSRQAPQRMWSIPQSRRRQPMRRPGRGGPIAMAATLAAGTLAGMMLAPASGSAFSPAGSPADTIEAAHTTPKTSRLPRASAVTATQAVPGAVKTPDACMPAAAPSRPGPIAYV